MNAWLEWGIPIIQWFQSLGDIWLVPMQFFSFLGTEYFTLLVLPALFWCYDVSLGIRLGLILLTSLNVNSMLKLAFGWPRPYWVSDQVRALSSEASYGFPSGHSQNALVLWGRLAAAFKRPAIRILCAFLILFISLSRIYLAVHYPMDILGGWLVGGLLLLIFLLADRPVGEWLKRCSLGLKILLSIVIPVILLAISLLILRATSQRIVPTEWIEHAQQAMPEADPIDPKNVEGFYTSAGALMGFGIGCSLLHHWGGFHAGGKPIKRIARYLLGVAGVVILYFGLKLIFPNGDTILGHLFRVLRYGLVTFWVTYLAPRTFVATRLA
jgi:membrane-associated phospholipid phosphatase